jgi:poly(3-hydroxybutyrate) depolymerase
MPGRLLQKLTPLVFVCAIMPITAVADELPSLNIDLSETSVSGLSSGAFMASQFHVAFSSTVQGAGIVGGGPFGCAEGQLSFALNRCMATTLGEPDAEELFLRAQAFAEAGTIDPLENLVDDRVYIFAGLEDETVAPAVGAQVAAFYRRAGIDESRLELDDSTPAGHGFLTEDGPVACASTGAPFVNDCDTDQAAVILEHIYGPLNPPASNLHESVAFNQADYLPDPQRRGMSEEGWVYVPSSCASGEPCRVHIAFHGCHQNFERVGDAFTVGAGFNRWAESNHVVVLYPQTHESAGNPNACWDWWGFTDRRYPTKSGFQMAAVHRMLMALAGDMSDLTADFCARHDQWNYLHWTAGRVKICGFGFACAAGSGDLVGNFFHASTLYEHPAGYFTTSACGE